MPTESRPEPAPSVLARVGVWPVRVLWLVQPVVSGPTYARALDGRVDSLESGGSVALWVLWGAVLVATLVPRTITLTAIRILLPAAVPAIAWATLAGESDAVSLVAVVSTVLTAVAALLPTVGDEFANGSSYGDERRMLLRPPGVLLLGPIELAWAVGVVGLGVGPFLLLLGEWGPGIAGLLLGLPAAALAIRALHGLAQRWIVFVPAGLVLHDAMAVADPILFARGNVERLGPARADTGARDLTLGALGLALEIVVRDPVPVTFGRLAGGDEAAALDALLFTPSRPGELLREARRRNVRVG